MDGLAAFWSARLDEDEAYLRTMIDVGEQAAARATPRDTADAYGVAMTVLSDPRARQIVEQRMVNPVPPPNDLKRLLREVEAKRKLLAEHAPECLGKYGSPEPAKCRRCITYRGSWQEDWQGDLHPCLTLRIVAAIWDDHPDYRPEWAPDA